MGGFINFEGMEFLILLDVCMFINVKYLVSMFENLYWDWSFCENLGGIVVI